MLATGAPAIVGFRVTALAAEPAVVDGAIQFTVPHEPGLRRVSLLHELTRPRRLPFERRGARVGAPARAPGRPTGSSTSSSSSA